jgi:hypothetical protein
MHMEYDGTPNVMQISDATAQSQGQSTPNPDNRNARDKESLSAPADRRQKAGSSPRSTQSRRRPRSAGTCPSMPAVHGGTSSTTSGPDRSIDSHWSRSHVEGAMSYPTRMRRFGEGH